MKVTSVNGHVLVPDAISVRVQGCYFVVGYPGGEVFYNDQGREVFRVTGKKSFWQKVKEAYAKAISKAHL